MINWTRRRNFDHILEGSELDVEEMTNLQSVIKDDGSQDRTVAVKASTFNAISTEGLSTREGNVGELWSEVPCQAPPF